MSHFYGAGGGANGWSQSLPNTSGGNIRQDDHTWMPGVVGYQLPRYQCEVERQRMEQAAHNPRGFRASFAALPGQQQRIYDSGNYVWVPSAQIPRFQCEVERQRFLQATAYNTSGGLSSYPVQQQNNNDVSNPTWRQAGYLPYVPTHHGEVARQRLGPTGGNSFGGIAKNASNVASSAQQPVCDDVTGNSNNNNEDAEDSNNNGSNDGRSSNNKDGSRSSGNNNNNNNGRNNNNGINTCSNINTKFSNPLPQAAIDAMTAWSNAHSSHVFPTRQQKEELAILGGITYKQVDKWFANLRVRQRKTKTPREIVAARRRPASPVLRLQTAAVLPDPLDHPSDQEQVPQSTHQQGQDSQPVQQAVLQPSQGQQSTSTGPASQEKLPQAPGNDLLEQALNMCDIDLHNQSSSNDSLFAWLSDPSWC